MIVMMLTPSFIKVETKGKYAFKLPLTHFYTILVLQLFNSV